MPNGLFGSRIGVTAIVAAAVGFLSFLSVWMIQPVLQTVTKQQLAENEVLSLHAGKAVRDDSTVSKNASFIESSTVVSWRQIRYRLSTRRYDWLRQSHQPLLVGLLSAAFERQQRNRVRHSWAWKHPEVIFVVGGNFSSALADEMREFEDILWLEWADTYEELTYKTATYLSAMHHLVPSFDYAFKSDAADSYVRLATIANLLQGMQLQHDSALFPIDYYGGKCQKGVQNSLPPEQFTRPNWPTYHWGEGYILSHTAIDCFARAAPQTRYLRHEDLFVGYVMEKCRFQCTKHGEVPLHPNTTTASIANMPWVRDWRFVEAKPKIPSTDLFPAGAGPSDPPALIEHFSTGGSLHNLTLTQDEISLYFAIVHENACANDIQGDASCTSPFPNKTL